MYIIFLNLRFVNVYFENFRIFKNICTNAQIFDLCFVNIAQIKKGINMRLFDLFKKKPKIKNLSVSITGPSNNELKKQMDHSYRKNKTKSSVQNSSSKQNPKVKISISENTRKITEKSLLEFKKGDIKKYEISSCNDERVCEICQKHDRKKYNVKNAVIGKNAPPFCDECRCVIIAVFKY